MLTKQQKIELVSEMKKKLADSKALVFAEFDKLTAAEMNKLRRELKKTGAELKVVKKTLLELVLKAAGVAFNPLELKTQMAVVFAPMDLLSIAALVQKFVKEIAKGKTAKFFVLSAYDASENRLVDANEFKLLATLPPREVLLAQIAMLLTMPIKKLMMTLNERSKQV